MFKFLKNLIISCAFVTVVGYAFLGAFVVSNVSHAEDISISAYKAESTTYAKAMANCTLYKTQSMSDSLDNIYFIVPETYFVVVIENVSDNCTKVQYDKFVGYVNSSNIVIATFIPVVRTLENISCDIKGTSGTQIWSIPSSNYGTIYYTISAGTVGIKYIASAFGNIPSGGESNLWYYVSYTPSSNATNVYEGYVYSENITNLTEIVANTESNPEVISPDDDTDNTLYISSTFRTIIIAIIAVPVILFIAIILYKIVKKLRENTNKHNFINKNRHYVSGETHEPNMYENYQNFSPLQSKLQRMKNTSFVKKEPYYSGFGRSYEKPNFDFNESNYPKFPTYSSDDDLL